MSIYEAVILLVGDVPTGSEPIVYVFCLILVVFVINSMLSFIYSFFK